MSQLVVLVPGAAALGYLGFQLRRQLQAVDAAMDESAPVAIHGRYAKVKVMQLNLLLMGCVLWPMVAVIALGDEWRSGVLVSHPLLWAVSGWVLGLLVLDLYMVASTPATSLDSVQHQQQEVKQTFMSVVGSVFAFGVLLSAITATPGGRSRRAAQIGITGLLIGMAFAIPVIDTSRNNMVTYALTTITKIACLMAVAIFMAGIVVELVPPAQQAAD